MNGRLIVVSRKGNGMNKEGLKSECGGWDKRNMGLVEW